jgi:DNA-binding IclR family transcriptional regulator
MADRDGAGGADIQAVSRARRILNLFGGDVYELVTAEVAEAVGLNRTTAHRYLTSMTAVGLLGPGSRHSSYVIGPLATRLGAIATGATPVMAVAPRLMHELCEELEATVTLSLWASIGAMVVYAAEPRTDDAVLTIRLGTVLAVNAAQSMIFAALRDDMAHRPFDAEVEHVRQTGFALARYEFGIIGIAAPIFDGKGLCAATGLMALSGSHADAALPVRSRRLREMAEQLSVELGATRRLAG